MAYNKSIEFRASINTSPSPPIRCPYYFAHNKTNCVHCHFKGNILVKEICDFLGLMLRREINAKKLDYLKGYIDSASAENPKESEVELSLGEMTENQKNRYSRHLNG